MRKNEDVKNLWLAVIAGGQGTRLFPLSYDACPKQFCRLDDENTFIQATVRRFTAVGVKPNHVVVITTNPNQTALANEQLNPLGVISPNIYEISPNYGYAGAMIKAAQFIYEHDKDAVIINTPSDQYIELSQEFIDTIKLSIRSAQAGNPTVIGVEINDLVTFMGCGHALYDPEESSFCKTVTDFVEKPNRKTSTDMMRAGNSACNTGINVWAADNILYATSRIDLEKEPLGTDELMAMLGELRLAIGNFRWFDCGTLKSLYEISKKTPNHKNATLGEGYVNRTDCLGSFFYCIDGIDLYATGIKGGSVVVNEIEGLIYVAVVSHKECQLVRELAEHYKRNENILRNDYSIKARNNIVLKSNFSDNIRASFVGFDDIRIDSIKDKDGRIIIHVSQEVPMTA